jgi:acyl-CoA synthetase (AMP-forming)/AMP-acid ligase II
MGGRTRGVHPVPSHSSGSPLKELETHLILASRVGLARNENTAPILEQRDTVDSGDLGYFDEEGYLYVVDRVKDVINAGGIQVSGSEVEDVLFQHQTVSEVVVISLPDEKWIEAVSAVVVPREEADTETLREELQEHARSKLAPFKCPKHFFYFVDDLPRNAAGKILKRELRDEFGSEGQAPEKGMQKTTPGP